MEDVGELDREIVQSESVMRPRVAREDPTPSPWNRAERRNQRLLLCRAHNARNDCKSVFLDFVIHRRMLETPNY